VTAFHRRGDVVGLQPTGFVPLEALSIGGSAKFTMRLRHRGKIRWRQRRIGRVASEHKLDRRRVSAGPTPLFPLFYLSRSGIRNCYNRNHIRSRARMPASV
jgi:hypothetical protein